MLLTGMVVITGVLFYNKKEKYLFLKKERGAGQTYWTDEGMQMSKAVVLEVLLRPAALVYETNQVVLPTTRLVRVYE